MGAYTDHKGKINLSADLPVGARRAAPGLVRPAGTRRQMDRLQPVPIQVDNERCIIVRPVMGPDRGGAIVRGAMCNGGSVEGIDGEFARRTERDVKSLARSPRARNLLQGKHVLSASQAEACKTGLFADLPIPEGTQSRRIEGSRSGEVCDRQRQMVKHSINQTALPVLAVA